MAIKDNKATAIPLNCVCQYHRLVPIIVFNQLIDKHTQNVNEWAQEYTPNRPKLSKLWEEESPGANETEAKKKCESNQWWEEGGAASEHLVKNKLKEEYTSQEKATCLLKS